MTGNAKLIERQAWNCDEWPGWLHEVVAETNEVADRLDMSAEQAHAYAALTALRSQPAGVKVKALEWGYDGDPDMAVSVVGGYVATTNGTLLGYLPKRVNLSNHETVDAAKAAAQADFDCRILSVLEPAILSKQGGER